MSAARGRLPAVRQQADGAKARFNAARTKLAPEIRDLLCVWETGTCGQVKADLRPRVTARLAQAAQRDAELQAI